MIAFYVSGHGFGHASRDIEVVNTLHAARPDIPLLVRTSAPRWIFDLTLRAPVEWMPLEADTGVAQVDSLRLDIPETLRRADAFHGSLAERAEAEARLLRDCGVRLVVGDIPPLAFAAARTAGLPSVALGNFTWDWIYGAYPEAAAWPRLVPALREAYSAADLALRLPLNGGFEPFDRIEDVPFIARRSTRTPSDVRARFGLPADRPLVLASFGGYGLRDIDLTALADVQGWRIVLTSNVRARRREGDPVAELPPAADPGKMPPNVAHVDERDIYAAGYRYEDIVAAVDAVATKPGYGIIAECIANDTAILYTSRGRFVEYDMLVAGMPRYLRCAFISNDELLRGRWQTPLDGLLAQPAPPERPRVDGAEVVAERLLELFE